MLSNDALNTECTKTIKLEVMKISPNAKIPYRKRETDAGYDLYSIEEIDLLPGKATMVRTGISISAPPGYYYTIEGRSSLWIQGIFPNRGIIDATFCGEIVVSLVNVASDIYKVGVGDRIAQIILHEQIHASFVTVDSFSEEYNQRGNNGFGSSGK